MPSSSQAGGRVLVTGGAGFIGTTLARELADSAEQWFVLDNQHPQVHPGSAPPADLPASVDLRIGDVTSAAEGEAAIQAALDSLGRIDVAVNCAGVAPGERIVGRDGPHRLESFARAIQINLIGTFNILRLAASAMTGNAPLEGGERGVIVNTASIAAFDGQIGQAAYAASKGGVAALTLPAARDLSRELIRVVTIAPGLFDTPLLAGLPEENRQALGASVPHPARLGDPDEYGQLAVAIVENAMLNGDTIRLDGAIRMAPK